MDLTREGLCSKANSIVSTVYGIMLWASSFPSPLQPTKDHHQQFVNIKYHFNFGLNTLTYPEKDMLKNANCRPRILHSYMIISPLITSSSVSSSSSSSSSCSSSLFPTSSLSSWSSSLTGDFIGTESGVYTSPCTEDIMIKEEIKRSEPYGGSTTHVRRSRRCEKKEIPPPIGRMPWALTRHYVDKRRLVIKMHKVKPHEYFKADRFNGRLVLKLVPLDDTVQCCHNHGDNDDLEEEVENEIDNEEETSDAEHIDNGDHQYVQHQRVVLADGASLQRKKAVTSFACSVPKSCRSSRYWESGDQYGRLCFTYAAGWTTGFGFGRLLGYE